MYSGQNILQNFNETPYQYTPSNNVPNIKIEREDDYENAAEDEGGYEQYGYSDSDVSHTIQPEIVHSTPNNVQNKLSAADKLKNFFLHEGIRLPRGTEILLAPSSSGDSGTDNGNPSAPLDHYQPDGNSVQPKYEKNYPCSLCDKAFSTELFLATHLRLHTLESLPEHQLNLERELDARKETLGANSNTFACPVCEKSFNMKRYLSNHLRSHNMKLVESDPNFDGQTQTYTCNQCQKSYTKKASFIAHMKAHDDRPYKCDVCSRLFKEINSLNVHKSLHSSNSKHQCNVCGLFFKFRSQLKIHEWTHSNNKFTCKFCAKIFRNYFSCKSHENNHINGKQFICCFCEKTFKYKVALKTHLITHTRPYKCDCCNRTFDTSLKLENHKKTHLFEKFQLNISEGGAEPETCIKVEPSELTDYDNVGSDGDRASDGYDVKSEHAAVDDCLVENLKLHFLEGGVNDLSEANADDKSGEYAEPSSTVLYSCQACQMDFKFLEEYQGHMASHQSNVNLNCKHCGQPFKRYKKLEKHLRKHNEYKCERCIKSFETEAELLQHTIYHKDESFKCNYCDSMFTNKYTVQYHIKRHLKRYRCKYCPKSFDNEAQLETHIGTHQSVYKCDYCDKDFKFQSLLSNHLKIHTRPFKCDKCDRSFDKSTMLSRHERNVHAPAPFVCHFCDRTFSYESTFNTHLRSHNRQYQCVYCMRSFDDQARYEKHVKRHEMQYTDLQCDKCDKKFKYKSQLQLHIKNHKNLYRCEQCQIQMKHWKSYEKHKKLVHGDGTAEAPEGSHAKLTEDAFKCDKCDKKFKYNSQLLLHLKQHKNVHRCDRCEMQFKHWKSYQKHVRSVHEQKQEQEEFACGQCEAKFRYQSQLKYHSESHNRKYACHCGKTFNSHKYFKSHQNSHTEGGLKCDFCAKEFRYYSELKLHTKKHLKECTFQCYHCERHFQTKAKLQRHIEVIHMRAPKSEFKCESCDKTFKYLSQLKTHSNLHERLYKCKLCDRSFNNKRYYIFHMNKHQNINLSCQQCGKTFPYYSKLQIHMKSHATAKRTMRKKCSWNCNLCGKRFKFQSLLKNHVKIHEGVKPYQCDYCGKRFAWKSSLQIHSSFVHKHKTNFHCESCDRYFFYESQYKQHMATCSWHVSFNCERCDKQLKSRKTYELHLLKHEGAKQFTCAYCDKGFYAKQVLVNHIKNHMEKETKTCPVCGQQFTSQYRYNIHVDTHSVEFRCSVCDRVFKCKYKLKRHVMTVHQRHATYSCEHCGKLFLREGALINHQAVHFGKQSGYEHSPMFGHVLDNFAAEEEVDVKPDIPELGILVPEVIYENHF